MKNLLNFCWIINSIIKSSFKRDPDLHNHALDALMSRGGESFNDSTNHQKKFKSGDGSSSQWETFKASPSSISLCSYSTCAAATQHV